MPRKKDYVSQRLANWIGHSKNTQLWNVLRQPGSSGVRENAIRKASDAFGLDPQNPSDRNLLLGILADVHFRERSVLSEHVKRGAPLKWNAQRVRKLLGHIKELLMNEKTKPSALNLAKRLKNRFEADYENITIDTLAKYLRSALPK